MNALATHLRLMPPITVCKTLNSKKTVVHILLALGIIPRFQRCIQNHRHPFYFANELELYIFSPVYVHSHKIEKNIYSAFSVRTMIARAASRNNRIALNDSSNVKRKQTVESSKVQRASKRQATSASDSSNDKRPSAAYRNIIQTNVLNEKGSVVVRNDLNSMWIELEVFEHKEE